PHIDKQVVRQAGHRTYERMLECGVRIFEYQRTMLHAKVMIVDANWASVASTSSASRSCALNEELNLSLRDRGVVAGLEKHFLADLDDARELELTAWQGPPGPPRGQGRGRAA